MATQNTNPTPTPLLEGFLTKEQLAAEFGKSERTIDRWHSRRIGPPRVVCGRLILYPRDAVREWLINKAGRK